MYFSDAHDVVVRFNHAPTLGYELDVGSKTDVRIVNSQVVTKPEFSFTTDAMYKNLTVIVWDPSDYTASLEKVHYLYLTRISLFLSLIVAVVRETGF